MATSTKPTFFSESGMEENSRKLFQVNLVLDFRQTEQISESGG